MRDTTDMIGHNVWRFMIDSEDGVVAHHLGKAMRDRVDVVFDFFCSPLDRWYARLPLSIAAKQQSYLVVQVRVQDLPWRRRRSVHLHHRRHIEEEGSRSSLPPLQGGTSVVGQCGNPRLVAVCRRC